MIRAAALVLAAVLLTGCGGGARYTLGGVNRCFHAAGWEGGLDKGPADALAVALGQFQLPGSTHAWYVTLERNDTDARRAAAGANPSAVELRRRNATLAWLSPHLPSGPDLSVLHRCFPDG